MNNLKAWLTYAKPTFSYTFTTMLDDTKTSFEVRPKRFWRRSHIKITKLHPIDSYTLYKKAKALYTLYTLFTRTNTLSSPNIAHTLLNSNISCVSTDSLTLTHTPNLSDDDYINEYHILAKVLDNANTILTINENINTFDNYRDAFDLLHDLRAVITFLVSEVTIRENPQRPQPLSWEEVEHLLTNQ